MIDPLPSDSHLRRAENAAGTNRTSLGPDLEQTSSKSLANHLLDHEEIDQEIPAHILAAAPKLVSTSQTIIKLPVRSLRFTCLTIGSRGDTVPYIALAQGLIARGHHVTIATHEVFRSMVEKYGIEFQPVGGDPEALMKLSVEHKMFSVGFFKESLGHFREWFDELLHESWEACNAAKTDVLIESPSTFAGIHVAEALKIPYIRCFTMPWTRTKEVPHAFLTPNMAMGPGYNYASYVLFDNIIFKATSSQINRFRKNVLNLPKTSLSRMNQTEIPFVYNFSTAVVPRPLDWPDTIAIAGYFFIKEDVNDKPPPGIDEFIKQARQDNCKIIYIGFGSITLEDPVDVKREIVETVKSLDSVRAILNTGWSSKGGDHFKAELDAIELTSDIFEVESVEHSYVFPLVDVALHHGGAGTTAASLRFGVPTLIKPFFGDQTLWATMVEKHGAGVKITTLKSSELVSAFEKALNNRVMKEKAEQVGQQIRAENGVENAIDFIYEYLERAQKLREYPETPRDSTDKQTGVAQKLRQLSIGSLPSLGSISLRSP